MRRLTAWGHPVTRCGHGDGTVAYERHRPGCVLLPGRVAASGWEVEYPLGLAGPDGLHR
jgi:hypothetical protein